VHIKSSCTDEIPFGAIISIIDRGRFIYLNNRLRPLGLSAGQVPVLILLYKEQNIMQDTLVRTYHLDKGTIARAVRKLVDAGYIRQTIDPDNRRAVRLFLTKKGERMASLLQEIIREWEGCICNGLSPDETGTLYALLRIAAQNSCKIMSSGGSQNAG
jgi:MarR family transcriptional regulator, temperature-dependent positive regulator of motility